MIIDSCIFIVRSKDNRVLGLSQDWSVSSYGPPKSIQEETGTEYAISLCIFENDLALESGFECVCNWLSQYKDRIKSIQGMKTVELQCVLFPQEAAAFLNVPQDFLFALTELQCHLTIQIIHDTMNQPSKEVT